MKRPDIVNDLIYANYLQVTVPVAGAGWIVNFPAFNDYALEIRHVACFLSYTMAAGSNYLLMQYPTGGGVGLQQVTIASPQNTPVLFPLGNPILIPRGANFYFYGANPVTVAGPLQIQLDGLIIPD